MKIEKINEHFTVKMEVTEMEIQSLLDLFESYAQFRNMPPDNLYLGLRGQIYQELRKLIK